jgi:hypothetical protein
MRREFGEAIDSLRSWQEKEDSTLSVAGFEATEDDLWMKDNVLFSRGAALQKAEQE